MEVAWDVPPVSGLAPPYDLLAAVLQDGTREWRAETDPSLPEEAVVWQPHPGMHSIGAIMLHIIAVEILWFERYVLDQELTAEEAQQLMLKQTDVDAWQWPDPPRMPLSAYFEWHDRVRARTLEGMKRWPPADAVLYPDEDPRTPRWVLGHVIQHEAYHGGQAVLLGRLWELK